MIKHSIALVLLVACTPTPPLDDSVEDIKAFVADISPHCVWGEPWIEKSADSQSRQIFECNGARLAAKGGQFETIESGFMNPDERYSKADYPDKYMPRVIAMVTALLPDWKDGRAWLETNINLGLSESRIATQNHGGVWVVVESYGVAGSGMSENGVTVVLVTKNPELARTGYGHNREKD